ncbi:MAG TPA: hypothetical protein VEM95_07960 [Thermoplasmata archaeon]|nr:hypothetical protein [Thermoplasmata archaeon]
MDRTAQIRWAARVLTLAATGSFLAWVGTLQPLTFLAALLCGGGAYAFFLVDRRRTLVEPGGYGRDTDDRVREGSEPAVGPGVSAGGIHLSFFTRSRWRAKR